MLHSDAWTQHIKIIAVFLLVNLTLELATQYRVRQVVMDLGWVDFDFGVPSSCPAPLAQYANFSAAQAEWGI